MPKRLSISVYLLRFSTLFIFPILVGLSVPLLLNSTAIAQKANQVNGSVQESNLLAPEFKFSVSGKPYTVKNDKLLIGNKSILLTEEGHIESLSYLTFEGDLIICYGIGFGGEGWGKIARITIDSGKIKWRTHIPTSNLGELLQENVAVYASGTGFVSKLNLRTGKYIWKHIFYDKYNIDAFDLPILKSNQVFFKESLAALVNGRARTVIVDKATGNIIKVLNR